MTYHEENADLENERWLEDCQANFQQAMTEGNTDLGEEILQDMKDKGFEKQANTIKNDWELEVNG